MLKYLAVAFVLTANLLGWQQTPKDQHPTGNNKATASQKAQAEIPPTHAPIDRPLPAVTNPQPPSIGSQKVSEDKVLPWFIRATKPEWVSVDVTVVYVIFTVFIWLAMKSQVGLMDQQRRDSIKTGAETLAAMNKQIDAMEQQIADARKTSEESAKSTLETLAVMGRQAELQSRSIDLQERAMQQWVDIVNWRTTGYRATSQGPTGNPNAADRLTISVDVVNPTNFPLTLPNASISFILGDKDTTTFWFRADCLFTPGIAHTAGIDITINEVQSSQFFGGGLRIRIQAYLHHIGSLEKLEPRDVSGVLTCSAFGRTWFEEETRNINPRQNPN